MNHRITDDELDRHLHAIRLSPAPWKVHAIDRRWLLCGAQLPGDISPVIAEGIRLEVQARSLARVPDAFAELAALRKWAQQTVDFLKEPKSNADLFNIMSAARRLGIE